MPTAGGCCDCQQTVMCQPGPGVPPNDPSFGEPAANWVCEDHRFFGSHCEGSGEIPQGVCEVTEDQAAEIRRRTAWSANMSICYLCGQQVPDDPEGLTLRAHEFHCLYRQTLEAAGTDPANPL